MLQTIAPLQRSGQSVKFLARPRPSRRHGWLHYYAPFPGGHERLLPRFARLWRARGAPADMALFGRTTADYEHQVWLLTPAAAEIAEELPGCWMHAGGIEELGWSLYAGRPQARQMFALAVETLSGRQP